MSSSSSTPLVIVGSGPAGCTAAIYAARAALKPIMVTGMAPGGQLTITTDVENYPGFVDSVQGPELMEVMQKQAERMGTQIVNETITSIDVDSKPFRLHSESGHTFEAQTVIFATGASARWLGLKSEEQFQGYGVSACATCDGFFFRDKDVAVVGGGNTAVEEALYLTHHARKVTLIHRRDRLRAEHILQQRLFAHEKIDVLWNHTVEDVLGIDEPRSVNGVRVRAVNGTEEKTLSVEGVFIAIGHDPATALLRGKVDMDEQGYLLVRPGTATTNVPGLFAAGDVCDKVYRQAVTAAGMGCMAALEAEAYLAAQNVTPAGASTSS
ncbi:MAG: thioredoxin-disulfide reductase [Alphaproteobacteria bacterium GM202ARS2]|nr:thioredoxin-disulfide reductase [Alphaproteobacteria bacterium GM202ARS2]